ncbi:MAG TPA: hypothetical protein VG713_11585, partial [Pirellulales bacterium]|nr:hypothetical protein [Pirellulales bacterium]
LVVESLRTAPNYLAYFNQLIGDHRTAYRHLVGSSLDWGQDLPGLSAWLREHDLDNTAHENASAESSEDEPDAKSRPKVFFSYYGSALPEHYGIDAARLPGFPDFAEPRIPEPLDEGVYCVSATMLANLYSSFPGSWTRKYETVYQQLVNNLRVFDSTAGNLEARKSLIAQTGDHFWLQIFRQYEQARMARLCSYLRQREPNAEINYSILIYRLNDEQLSRALHERPVELIGDGPTTP